MVVSFAIITYLAFNVTVSIVTLDHFTQYKRHITLNIRFLFFKSRYYVFNNLKY